MIITKHVTLGVDVDAQVAEGIAELNDLFHASPDSYKFRAVGSSFNRSLLLGIPINWCSISKM